MGVNATSRKGTEWKQIDGSLKQISVGGGRIMGVDADDGIWSRDGIDRLHPEGTKWSRIEGSLRQISIGDGKIVGTDETQIVHFHDFF